jgi:hypothetical protein
MKECIENQSVMLQEVVAAQVLGGTMRGSFHVSVDESFGMHHHCSAIERGVMVGLWQFKA